MSLKDLTKNTFILAAPKVIRFFTKLVRAKLNALLIGTTGVGIVNQLQDINTRLGSFSTLSLNVGAKKLIVSNNNTENKEQIPYIVTLYATLVLVFAIVTYILGYIFFDDLSSFFLGEGAQKYFIYVYVFFPLIPLATIPITVLGGLQEFKSLAKAEIIVILISFLLYIPLIYYYKTQGAVIAVAVSIGATFIVFFYYVFFKIARKRNQGLLSFKGFQLRKKIIREISMISGISSVLGIYGVFVELTIRGTIVSELGIDSIGIYAPIIAWSAFFSSLFLPSLFQYIFPKYGSSKNNKELISVANNGFRLLTFMIIPFVLIIISLRSFLIPLLYSDEFLVAEIYLPLHFIGIFFWTWMRIMKQMFIPTGRIKALTPLAIVEETLILLVVILFIGEIGLWAWCFRFSLVPFIMFITYLAFLRKKIHFKIFRENYLLMLYGILTSILITFISMEVSYSVVFAFLFVVSLYFFLKKSEKQYVFNTIRRYFTKPNKG